jgi:NAD(P)-dependent dehydrogenase (short-subunit alcohol dehydrogenase family)
LLAVENPLYSESTTRSEGVEKSISDIARTKNVAVGEIDKEFFRTARPSSLLQRFATTNEVTALVRFVASPRSSMTNGAALRVEGGVVRSIF